MPADPYKYFRLEARELLDQLGEGILALERGGTPGDVTPRLLRDAHTLKGAARVVRLVGIADKAHALEDLLSVVRDRGTACDAADVQPMLALVDEMRAHLAGLPAVGSPAAAREANATTPRVAVTASDDDRLRVFRPDTDDLDAVTRGLAVVSDILSGMDSAVRDLQQARRLVDVLDDHLSESALGRHAPADLATQQGGLRAIASDVRRRLGTLERNGVQGLERASRELRQVAEAAGRLRLAPARAMFRFLERATRDAAQVEGKQVRFEAQGGDIRLEPEMLGVLQSACLHLVRNAIVHGIESDPRLREASGKPGAGTIVVALERERQHVRVSCRDDGAGIDMDRVRQALRRRGLALPRGSDRHAILQLLLESDISTAEAVTPLAGRGVGLGVVREAASRLGGRVEIDTEPCRGTTVALIVPFALASIPALLFEVADVPAALPLDAVSRIVTIHEPQLVRDTQRAALMVDGGSVPVGTLHQIVAPERPVPSIVDRSALLVRSGDRCVALVVDRVLHAAVVTVQPLPALAPAGTAVIGASIDPAGKPRLVFDPQALVDLTASMRVDDDAPASPAAILVVDDSLTTRMLEQSILESAGYVVGLASSGEEGLEKARTGEYSLFLVDVEMPGMDGFTFVQRVRADPAIGRTPIVLVTSRGAQVDRERGRSVGANAYIVKSEFDQPRLLRQIRSLIQA